jgi:hypothetical protein
MENGKWRMENGEWRMENGEWEMGNGKWDRDATSSFPVPFSILHSPFPHFLAQTIDSLQPTSI